MLVGVDYKQMSNFMKNNFKKLEEIGNRMNDLKNSDVYNSQ